MIEKETLTLDKNILSVIMKWHQENLNLDLSESENYELIENTILSTDSGDGGFTAIAIVKRKSDNKFFKLDYEEWDYHWEYGSWEEYEPELNEVFPKTITKIIYE